MDENKMPENDGWKKNARLAIYAMAGFYLLTLAYQMFRAISTSHGNEQLVMIVATILFLIVGVGLIGFPDRRQTAGCAHGAGRPHRLL